MRRKQIYLDDASERALKRAPAGRPEASHIREALQRYLAGAVEAVDDPLEQLIGLVATSTAPTTSPRSTTTTSRRAEGAREDRLRGHGRVHRPALAP